VLLPSLIGDRVGFPTFPLVVIPGTTTFYFSGLYHTACFLTTPGSIPNIAVAHAGSLLSCWLGFAHVGLGSSPHPHGNADEFLCLRLPLVTGFAWRDTDSVAGIFQEPGEALFLGWI
jgi:hypothetical protein